MKLTIEHLRNNITIEQDRKVINVYPFTFGSRQMLQASESTTTSAADDITLTILSKVIQFIDPNGADRIITLPAADVGNHGFLIVNIADADEDLVVKNDAGTTLATVYQGGAGWFVSNGVAWKSAGLGTLGWEIKDNGVLKTKRSYLNFIGMSITDDAVNDQTIIKNMPAINALINGGFRVAQRGTTFTAASTPANSDDTYLLDRWVLLSDGNDIVDVSQSTDAPDGAKNSIKLEVETANKQFGILQIIENKDALAFKGKTASLSFYAKMAAADDNTHSLKAAVLAWSSTADVVTSDVVSAWGASPTLVANWTAENVAGSNALTTGWQRFTIEGIAIDTASMANLAVLIYCDQIDGVIDDAVFISGVKLEVGITATDFIPRPYAQEFDTCLWYYERFTTVTAYYQPPQSLQNVDSSNRGEVYLHWSRKRVAPSVALGTYANWVFMNIASAANHALTANLSFYLGIERDGGNAFASCGATLNINTFVVLNTSVDGEYLEVSAEL